MTKITEQLLQLVSPKGDKRESQQRMPLIPKEGNKREKGDREQMGQMEKKCKRTDLNLIISITTVSVKSPKNPLQKQNVRLDEKVRPTYYAA